MFIMVHQVGLMTHLIIVALSFFGFCGASLEFYILSCLVITLSDVRGRRPLHGLTKNGHLSNSKYNDKYWLRLFDKFDFAKHVNDCKDRHYYSSHFDFLVYFQLNLDLIN